MEAETDETFPVSIFFTASSAATAGERELIDFVLRASSVALPHARTLLVPGLPPAGDAQYAVHELAEGRELLALHELERVREEHEVLEERVEVRLGPQVDDAREVRVVHVLSLIHI